MSQEVADAISNSTHGRMSYQALSCGLLATEYLISAQPISRLINLMNMDCSFWKSIPRPRRRSSEELSSAL